MISLIGEGYFGGFELRWGCFQLRSFHTPHFGVQEKTGEEEAG